MRFFLLLLLVATVGACADPATQEYVAGVQRQRVEMDASFRNAETTPLKPEHRDGFEGLSYYPVNPAYRIEAWLTPASDTRPFRMASTGDTAAWYRRYATAAFTLGGQSHTLHLYQSLGLDGQSPENQLFLPFTDATSNRETYGGGRYLDLPMPTPGATTITLDFNRAYNPFCVYNSAYSCAIPPAENRLSVPVEAGMKMWTPS